MSKYLAAFYLFCIFFLIYWLGSFDKIPFADSIGILINIKKENWATTATSTNHFLFTNSLLLFQELTGLETKVASKLFIIISAAATVVSLYFCINLLVKKNWIAITSAFVFGFSFSFWRNAEIIEVYTFYLFWVSLYFLFLLKYFQSHKNRFLILSSLFLVLSFWTHILSITILPGFLLLILFEKNKEGTFPAFLIFILLFASLFILNESQGLSYKSVYTSGIHDWVGDSFRKSFHQYLKDVIKSVGYLFYNFNFFTILGFYGIWKLFKKNKKLFYIFLISSTCNYGFATIYAVSDNYIFFIPFNLIFSFFIAYGLLSLEWKKTKILSLSFLFIPIFYLISFTIISKTNKGVEFHKTKSYKGGLRYYLLPWMNNNVGILEFTLEKKKATDPIQWMTKPATEYIEILKKENLSKQEIKKY